MIEALEPIVREQQDTRGGFLRDCGGLRCRHRSDSRSSRCSGGGRRGCRVQWPTSVKTWEEAFGTAGPQFPKPPVARRCPPGAITKETERQEDLTGT